MEISEFRPAHVKLLENDLLLLRDQASRLGLSEIVALLSSALAELPDAKFSADAVD